MGLANFTWNAFILNKKNSRWARIFFGLVIFYQPLISFATTGQSGPAPVAVVLVPGVLNVLIPAFSKNSSDSVYFAADIRDQFHKLGIQTHVVENLLPTSDLYENAQRTLADMEHWYKKTFPKGGTQIVMVGHSSGGLYSMRAAALNTTLPIKKIIGISVPVEGTQLATAFGLKKLNDLLDTSAGKIITRYMDLRGLGQMAPETTRSFVSNSVFKDSIQLILTGGGQPSPVWAWEYFDSKFLYPLLSLTAAFIGSYSDGIVPFDSAMAKNTKFGSGGAAHAVRLSHVDIGLDHFEQILELRLLQLIGNRDLAYVAEKRRKFYTGIARLSLD